MATQQITIDGKNGVFFSFEEKDRWTIYEIIGTFTGTIDESTTLLDLVANNQVRLVGFAVKPSVTDNPYIGGFEPPVEPDRPIPPQNEGYLLTPIACANNYAYVWVREEKYCVRDETKVQFQLLLFSLTYNEALAKLEELSICSYTIRGEDGLEYVKMVQDVGAKAGQWGGTCPNNHPRHEDHVEGLGKYDCQVYLPKQTYYVDFFDIKGAYILGWVHQPNPKTGNGDIFKGELQIGDTYTVRIDKSEFENEFWHNAIKINGNCV